MANQWLYVQWCDNQYAVSSLASFSLLRRFVANTRVPKLLALFQRGRLTLSEVGDLLAPTAG